MEGLAPFSAAFALIAVLELGDKTQLATISLAARYPRAHVLLGASAGLALVTAVGVAAGAILAGLLGAWLVAIKIVGGALFIVFAVLSFRRSEVETPQLTTDPRGAFWRALAVNILAETGDKTQLAVVILAATTEAPLSVFAGGSLGLIAVAVGSVLIGAAAARALRAQTIRIVSTALFVAAGVLLIAEAIVGG